MTRVSVDEQLSQINIQGNERLVDVLQMLLASLPPNRIVKDILVDGETLPRHVRTQALECGLQDVGQLEIRTADKAIWAVNGVDMCLSDIDRLLKSLVHVTALFREEEKSKANRFFAQCIEGMERFLETLLITRAAAKLDFTKARVDGVSLASLESELSTILKNILRCQEQNDCEGIAERVEYELMQNLHVWKRCLHQIKNMQNSNA